MSAERVHRGTAAHLRRLGEPGVERAGWKIGFNVPAVREALGISERVVGHLTSTSVTPSPATLSLSGLTDPRAEPEIAIHVGEGGTIAGLGAAIELVDVTLPFEDVEAILERNVFHHAAVLGPVTAVTQRPAYARVRHRDDERQVDPGPATGSLDGVVAVVAGILAEHVLALRAGDVIIAGSFATPIPVAEGEEVVVDLGDAGSASLTLSP